MRAALAAPGQATTRSVGSLVRRVVIAGLVVLLVLIGLNRDLVGRFMVGLLDAPYAPPEGPLVAGFDGSDADRARVEVRLDALVEGLTQPTDLAFVPGEPTVLVVTEKGGRLVWVDLADGDRGALHQFDVLTASEQGLLGLAWHPRFPATPELFVNLVRSVDGVDTTVVERCLVVVPVRAGGLGPCEVVLTQKQPYQNHNAGQLAFGPDGYLYVGFGDGGLRADPLDAGQDPDTWLGKMLRIDVDTRRPYAVPTDNPFVGNAGTRAEIWATGLRNPWRFHFTPDARLVVADVGQNAWEEVSIAGRGANLGWSRREGRVCFPKPRDCAPGAFTEPVWVYGRDEGSSITGGVVATGTAVPALAGKYVFGDFVSGRLWALDLPGSGAASPPAALGKWPILPVAFARDPQGDVVVADFGRGVVFAVRAP